MQAQRLNSVNMNGDSNVRSLPFVVIHDTICFPFGLTRTKINQSTKSGH